MIGHYLPNNNENATVAILQNFLHLNEALGRVVLGSRKGWRSALFTESDQAAVTFGFDCVAYSGILMFLIKFYARSTNKAT